MIRMEKSTFSFQAEDGANIHVYKWMPEGTVRCVVQIAHGMVEHAARYEHFAQALTSVGYAVYANDHRGHGKTANSQENLGHFADENGWESVVNDLHNITTKIKEKNPNLPIILLGHSMGSFLSKSYIQKYGHELAGVILSGTNSDQGLLSDVGILIAKCEERIRGKQAKSKLLNKLSFGSFNKRFKPNRTEFDWLSRDEGVVDRYIDDQYCGGIVSAGFFHDMLSGIKQADRQENLKKVPRDLPIFMIAGENDPVGNYTKLVKSAVRNYKKVGIQDLQYKFYPGARHEILNETNKEEVYRDVIEWIETKITGNS